MKLSIIIPVYRTQDTLQRCVDSILSQSFTDLEVVLVDDGSPDHCPILCDDYAKKDPRVSVIHKENGGLSDARNAGILQAQGEYITFIDSDDEIAPNTLEPLMTDLAKRTEIDILEYPVLERKGHSQKERLLTFLPKNYFSALDYWFEGKAFEHTYACNKIYKRQLFEHVKFPVGKAFEDVYTLPLLIGLLPYDEQDHKLKVNIRTTNVGRYIYHWNEKGITANATAKELHQLYEAHDKTMNYVVWELKFRPELLEHYCNGVQCFLTHILNILLDLYEEAGYEKQTPSIVKELPELLDLCTITSFKLNMLSLLGYRRLCKLSKMIHKFYKRH